MFCAVTRIFSPIEKKYIFKQAHYLIFFSWKFIFTKFWKTSETSRNENSINVYCSMILNIFKKIFLQIIWMIKCSPSAEIVDWFPFYLLLFWLTLSSTLPQIRLLNLCGRKVYTIFFINMDVTFKEWRRLAIFIKFAYSAVSIWET